MERPQVLLDQLQAAIRGIDVLRENLPRCLVLHDRLLRPAEIGCVGRA